VFWFKEHEYEVDSVESDERWLIQARKTGKLRTLMGTNIAFKISLYSSEEPNEFVFESATGQWMQNITGAGVTALFTGGLTLITGAAGVAWTAKVERDIVEFMEHTLQFKKTKTLDDKGTVTQAAPPPVLPMEPPPIPSQFGTAVEATVVAATPLSPRDRAIERVREDMKKLDAAKEAGILNDDEYNAKKAAISAKVAEYEVQFVVEEKAVKLRDALTAGILDQAEYDAKVAALETLVRDSINKERNQKVKVDQMAKLKAALDNGILSQDEYDAKVRALE